MATRQELIDLAQKKFQREQLISQAQEKWKAENLKQVQPEPIGAEKIETAARSALEGAFFGVSEPAISRVNSVIGNLIDSGFEAEGLKDFFSKSIDSVRLEKEYKRDVARRRGLESQLPEIALASEIAGALVSPIGLGKGVATAGKAAVAGVERALAPVLEVAPVTKLLPEALAKAGKRIAEASATGVAGEALKQAAEVPTGFIKPEERLDLGQVGTSTAALTGALETIPLVGKAMKAGGAKALSAFGGVKEKVIKDYLKKTEPMLPVTTEALKDQVDNAVARVQAGLVEQRKQGADDLLTAVKALKDKVIQGSKESYEILEQAGISKPKQFKDFKFDIDDDQISMRSKGVEIIGRDIGPEYQSFLETSKELPFKKVLVLEDINVKPQFQGKGIGTKAVQVFEEKAKELGFDAIVLNASPTGTNKKAEKLDDLIRFYKKLGFKTFGKKETENQLMTKAFGLSKIEGPLKTLNASSILKDIDAQINAQKAKTGDILLTPLRESVAAKLEDLKGRVTSLVDQIGPKFDLATGKQVIQSLDEITEYAVAEGQFSSRLDQALKSIRSNLNQQLRTLSPEYAKKMDEVAKDTRLLELALDTFGTEQKALSGLQTLAVGKNPRINELANQLESATGVKIARGVQAIKKTIPVEKLDPKTTQSFLKSVMSGRSIESKKTLSLLSQLADEDLTKLAEDAAMTQEFEKLTMNGSRDVNFWKEMLGGATAAGAVGGTFLGGPGGAMVGAGIGYLVKTFGAPTTKKILDGMIQIQGIPTVKKLNSALSEVTPAVKNDLINGFIRANTVSMEKDEPQKVRFTPEQAVQVSDELKSSKLDSVTKAKAINSLKNNQEVDTQVLKKHMLGVQPKAGVVVPVPSQENSVLKEDRPEMLKALDRVKK